MGATTNQSNYSQALSTLLGTIFWPTVKKLEPLPNLLLGGLARHAGLVDVHLRTFGRVGAQRVQLRRHQALTAFLLALFLAAALRLMSGVQHNDKHGNTRGTHNRSGSACNGKRNGTHIVVAIPNAGDAATLLLTTAVVTTTQSRASARSD